MHLITKLITLICCLLLAACVHKGMNPDDPYESINRKTHQFNMAIDAAFLKPPAKLYKTIVPEPVRLCINNVYNNIYMIPTVANDLLQAEWQFAIKDSWRFLINSTFGIAGLFDVADKHFKLPPHSNDLGLTFAKWGDKKSPYIVIPFLGPSTIRDGMGMVFEYTLFTPYPYLGNDTVIYSLIGLRYIDLRSQLFETEKLMNEALDPYSFVRDAYLQYRNNKINGEQDDSGSLYVEDNDENSAVVKNNSGIGNDYVDE